MHNCNSPCISSLMRTNEACVFSTDGKDKKPKATSNIEKILLPNVFATSKREPSQYPH